MSKDKAPRPAPPLTVVEEALANVASIGDPEMKRIAFEAELKRLPDARRRWERRVAWAASLAGATSVMVGILVSIESFAEARKKDADSRSKESDARTREDDTRRQALLQPSLDLRRDRYLEILSTLGKIAADGQDAKVLADAKRRFWELYWADLSLVEDTDVKHSMQELSGILDDDDSHDAFQEATYRFAGLIRTRIMKLEDQTRAAIPMMSDAATH